MTAEEIRQRSALTTLSELGWLATAWHGRFSTEELAAAETVKGALRRIACVQEIAATPARQATP